ncbi:Protein hgh1 [Lecanora helva]
MPSELEELVEFLHHGNTQIRQIAAENLVPFSKTQPDVFKTNQLRPVEDLKVLVRDYKPIAKNALTILINVSDDNETLKCLAEDDDFLEDILGRLTSSKEATADDLSMLLANLSKCSSIERLITLERSKSSDLSSSKRAITQLIELFNQGADKNWNKNASYDYLAYVFADLAKFLEFAKYLTTPTSHTPLDPLTLFLPHTTHSSPIRRLGIASLLKNLALIHPDILYLLQPAQSVLPPLLLPLCSSNQEGLSEEEMDTLPEECQYLTADHVQEGNLEIIKIELETIWLLATRGGIEGKRLVKERGTYPIIRELHLQMEDEGVRKGCEMIVDIIMGDESVGGSHEKVNVASEENSSKDGAVAAGSTTQQPTDEDEDEDNEIVPIF